MTTRQMQNTITTIKDAKGNFLRGEDMANEAISYYHSLLGLQLEKMEVL